MKNLTLGRLEQVDVRLYWTSEPYDFTPWLAREENLALLGDTIGIELALEAQEKDVGPYRADILCKDTANDTWVLIENQLEKTDHTHLGQLMTYASGLNAVTIVWIASRFTDEHRAALDWLNEITDEGVNFFGLEIELWRIGESAIAPKFNIVSQPNEWTRFVSNTRQTAGADVSEIKQQQLEYWTTLRQYLQESGSPVKSQKPFPQHWTNFALGRSYFQLVAAINTRDDVITVSLSINDPNAKLYFRLLYEQREKIEEELGFRLEWRELPHKKSSDMGIYNRSFSVLNKEQWPLQHQWLKETLEAFYHVFSWRVKSLNLKDYGPSFAEDMSEQ